ncbi:MAG TPA: T9SS type A sorting domain-containing protein, partial [Flavobacteriales bacterium]|nr:T9SS type A sorting domain-containing protein [Flavobacteriales bacterium]
DTSFIIPNQATSTLRFIAVASIDAETIMSPFGLDKFASSNTTTPPDSFDDLPYGIDCSIAGLSEFEINNLSPYTLECYPNPWTESTTIEITSRNYLHSEVVATIELRDIQGRLCMKEKINLTNTTSTVTIDPVLKQGIYTYSLIIDGTVLETKRMIKLR